MTVLLIGAIVGLAWVLVRVVGGLSAGGESSARADTFADGRGVGTEHIDSLRASKQRGNGDA